jgi:hypothetical protein
MQPRQLLCSQQDSSGCLLLLLQLGAMAKPLANNAELQPSTGFGTNQPGM